MRATITIDTPDMDADSIMQFMASIREAIASNAVTGIVGARIEAHDSDTGNPFPDPYDDGHTAYEG